MRRPLTCLLALALLTGATGASGSNSAAEQRKSDPIDAAERERTIRQLADALTRMYVKPAAGERYAAALRAELKRGTYDELTEPKAFAQQIVADLKAINSDAHLRLLGNEVFEHHGDLERPAKPGLPEGIEEMRMIGRVAYLRFDAFPHDPRTAPAARTFLLANAGRTKAVVIDARPLPGGGLEVMDAILPLFFARRTMLLRLETRSAADKNSPFADGPTLVRTRGRAGYVTRDHVVAPDPSEQRLRAVPLYYLTSSRTASAGEHLALALKRTGRATLIGERTRGAGHYVALVPVGTHLTALVPVGRAYDPDTGSDWEGRGVSPHIEISADQALDEALRRIR